MVLHTNDRHRFLKDGFQPVNSFQYTTAAMHERDKYSWHAAFICIKYIFMNKRLPLPLTVFAVQSVKNGPSSPSCNCWVSMATSPECQSCNNYRQGNSHGKHKNLPIHSRLDSSTSLHQILIAGFIWLIFQRKHYVLNLVRLSGYCSIHG